MPIRLKVFFQFFAHLKSVIDIAARKEVKVIIVEPFYCRKAADKVARETGVHVLVLANSTGGQKGADDYLAMIDNTVNSLTEILR